VSLTDTALFLAEQWPVFPCDANKRPVTEHGFKDATRDPAQIAAMFRRPGACMIGVPTGAASDLLVIDLDVKDGRPGLEWLAANQHRIPRTRQHSTRSGGRHLLFRYPQGRDIRNSASKIAPGVDCRANGGYIITAPSAGYSVLDDAMPADPPAWLIALLDPPAPPPRPAQPLRNPAPGEATKYGRTSIDSACDRIASAHHGQKHDTLNREAYGVGQLVAGGEITDGEAFARLQDALEAMHARQPCEDYRAAVRTLHTAYSQGKAAPRSAPPPRYQDVRIRVEVMAPEPPPREAPPDYWEAEPVIEIEEPAQPATHLTDKPASPGLPLVYWNDIQPSLETEDFVEGVLSRQAMSVVYGPSNCGKTFWASDLSMHVATGRQWNGRQVDPGGVIYCALEGGAGIRNRVAAWRKFHGLDGVEVPFAIIPVTLNLLDPLADATRVCDAIHAAAREFGVRVMLTVMDTLARAMAGGNENSPEDMGALVTNGTMIQQVTGSHLMWIHHSGKDQAQGARGHSSLRAATDTEIEIGRPDKDSPSTANATKQREMDIDGEWSFSLQKVDLGINRRGKPVTSCVVQPADGVAKSGPKLAPGAKFALAALHEVMIGGGQPSMSPSVPQWARVVRLDAWRQAFYQRSHLDNPQTKKKAFQRAVSDLRDAAAIGFHDDYVWIADAKKPL
jgi:hypothetical protein